jgi:hypothetical protein
LRRKRAIVTRAQTKAPEGGIPGLLPGGGTTVTK